MSKPKSGLFIQTDYKSAIRDLIEERKAIDPSINFEKAAAAMGVQKSYLSRVLKDQAAHLTSDQLFRCCRFLALSAPETEFMELLLESAKSSVPERREILLKKIQRLQQRSAQTTQVLSELDKAVGPEEMKPFYLDATHQLVHICLTIPKFQTDSANRLSTALGFSKRKVNRSLRLLESLNLASQEKEGWKAREQKTHVPPESPYFLAWRSQLRMMGLNRQQVLEPSESYSFSVVFSATEEIKNQIQFRFLELLKTIQPEVVRADPQHCYQLNFDLIPWA
jgi:transcriptional regulator with XRE-family HTH domain